MMKMMLTTMAVMIAGPASGQTTTTCRHEPAWGGSTVCNTTAPQRQPELIPYVTPQPVRSTMDAREYDLRLREQALRDRELRLREAEAGIVSPPPVAPSTRPSSGSRLRRALIGF